MPKNVQKMKYRKNLKQLKNKQKGPDNRLNLVKKPGLIIGVGHPRTGTGYTHKTLRDSGLDVGHESWKNDGIVYWALSAPNAASLPAHTWYDFSVNKNINWDSAKVIHVARSPFNSVSGAIQHNYIDANAACGDWIHKQLEYNLNVSRTGHRFTDGLVSLMYWYELTTKLNPGVLYRVDKPEDNDKLSDFLGVEIKPHDNKKYNTRPESREKLQADYNNFSLNPEISKRFASFAYDLGYEKDAEKIEGFISV